MLELDMVRIFTEALVDDKRISKSLSRVSGGLPTDQLVPQSAVDQMKLTRYRLRDVLSGRAESFN